MNVVQKIGFFIELPLQERIASLQAIRQDVPHPYEDKILLYLEAGTVFGVMPGIEEDVLAFPPQVIGLTRVLTDGVWAWPEALTYYVRRYHINLPEEFVVYMRLHKWTPPSRVDVGQLTLEGDVAIG